MSRDYTAAIGGGGDAAVIADLAAQAVGVVQTVGDAHVVIVPAGAEAQVVDLEEHSYAPNRTSGTAKPKSVDALIAYVRRHQTPQTTIWVEPTDGHIIAVLNDHGAQQEAAWGDLRADLRLPTTPEWDHWISRDGAFVDQGTFAEHVEDGLAEVRAPSSADLLEIAQTMQATVSADFRSASRLHDGSIVASWAEHVDARAGNAGDLEIPKQIELALAPFYGEQPYEVTARIRYRIRSGSLSIGYKLDRPDIVVRDCLNGIRARLTEEFGPVVYTGAPAPARAAGAR